MIAVAGVLALACGRGFSQQAPAPTPSPKPGAEKAAAAKAAPAKVPAAQAAATKAAVDKAVAAKAAEDQAALEEQIAIDAAVAKQAAADAAAAQQAAVDAAKALQKAQDEAADDQTAAVAEAKAEQMKADKATGQAPIQQAAQPAAKPGDAEGVDAAPAALLPPAPEPAKTAPAEGAAMLSKPVGPSKAPSVEDSKGAAPVEAAQDAPADPPPPKTTGPCAKTFNDCDWDYTVVGGAEESALSAQDSETNPFIALFVRAPLSSPGGNLWLLARFLGAANANNTNNVVSAFQTATGSGATSGLPQVGTAVDYAFGYQYDFVKPGDRQFSVGLVGSFGATTPLSAQHATTAYQVPAYGTNECNQLLARFPSSLGAFGLPAQPSSPYITMTPVTTPAPAMPPAATTTGPFCIINPAPTMSTMTANGATTVTTTSGTQIQDIAFAPEDRNSFLLKYAVGLRIVNRWLDDTSKSTNVCGTKSTVSGSETPSTCTRTVVDLTFGQDEAITGGKFGAMVFKADAIFPVSNTGVFFFGSSSIRFEANKTLSPLILLPATIVTSSPSVPANIVVPSASTWVLPLTQPDRDFYRVGIGMNLNSLISKLLPKSGG